MHNNLSVCSYILLKAQKSGGQGHGAADDGLMEMSSSDTRWLIFKFVFYLICFVLVSMTVDPEPIPAALLRLYRHLQ